MSSLLKRIQRLEENAPRVLERPRIVRVLVEAIDGRPAPRDLRWATARRRGREDVEDTIFREPGEPMEAFEARAAAHFPGDYMIGPGKPC